MIGTTHLTMLSNLSICINYPTLLSASPMRDRNVAICKISKKQKGNNAQRRRGNGNRNPKSNQKRRPSETVAFERGRYPQI